MPRPPKKQHDADGDPLALAIRYFYRLPPRALFNHCDLLFTTAAIKLLAKRIWRQSLAEIKKVPFLGGASNASSYPAWPPEEVANRTITSTTSSSLATAVSQEVRDMISVSKTGSSSTPSLPQVVVDTIVDHLVHDTPSLLACSLTSRSWSIAAVPHLHRTLSTRIWIDGDEKTKWPNPLQRASKFGWLPFVARLFIDKGSYGCLFSLTQFDRQTQLEFSALTNVQELHIADLDIPSFVPTIQQYFGQFSPTVRYLTLISPRGSCRQIVFFIGLFQHLEDLWLDFHESYHLNKQGDDLALVPCFFPPLRGRLTAISVRRCGLARTMVDLFGELRFRHLDIYGSDGAQLLVYACANALEGLWLSATDLCGEISCSKDMRVLANGFTGGLHHRDLDLSRNGSLQKIQIEAGPLFSALRKHAPRTIPSIFRAILSTINSPAFSHFIVVYQAGDFYNVAYSERKYFKSEATWYCEQFEVFREMRKVRDFQLVLQACCVSDISVRELERAVAVEKAKGGLPRLSWTYTLAAR